MSKKYWSQDQIDKLIMENDKFVINCLKKLDEFGVIWGNDFEHNLLKFYNEKGYLTKKQIFALRKNFLERSDIFYNIANELDINYDHSNDYENEADYYFDIGNMEDFY